MGIPFLLATNEASLKISMFGKLEKIVVQKEVSEVS